MENKRTKSRLYDHKRDDKMKGHTKHSQQKSIDAQDQHDDVQETSNQLRDEIGTGSSPKKISGMENLMEMDEDSLINKIASKDMIPEITLKLHCKKLWDDYFKNKSIIGRAQLFAKLFSKREMNPVLEFLGVDNKKISPDTLVKETIIENLKEALNCIDNTSRGVDLSVAHRALMIMITSKKLTR